MHLHMDRWFSFIWFGGNAACVTVVLARTRIQAWLADSEEPWHPMEPIP